MRKFKVKALSFHSDKVQIIYKAGDEITEDVMHADQIEKHIEDGFIEEIVDEPAKEDAPQMIDHVVTQEDLDNNPELVANGVQVGETIQVPATEKDDDKAATQTKKASTKKK